MGKEPVEANGTCGHGVGQQLNHRMGRHRDICTEKSNQFGCKYININCQKDMSRWSPILPPLYRAQRLPCVWAIPQTSETDSKHVISYSPLLSAPPLLPLPLSSSYLSLLFAKDHAQDGADLVMVHAIRVCKTVNPRCVFI